MKKGKKAVVKQTGEKIRVKIENGFWRDQNGTAYLEAELEFTEKRHDVRFGFHIWRVGLYLFAREYLKYNSWFIVPGVSIDAVNGYDGYLDVELKFLCFGVGIRFIWLKNWRFLRFQQGYTGKRNFIFGAKGEITGVEIIPESINGESQKTNSDEQK